jgi:hypothetical protein
VASEGLEQLVHKEPEVRPKKKLNRGGLALVIVALTMTGAGVTTLVVLVNGLGLILLVAGLVMILYIAGGVGSGFKTGGVRVRAIGGTKASLQGGEDRREEEERKKRRGEKD